MINWALTSIKFLNDNIWDKVYLGNRVIDLLLAASVFIIVILGLTILKKKLIIYLEKMALQTETLLDDLLVNMLQKTNKLFYCIIAIYIACDILTLSVRISTWMNKLFIITLILQAAFWINSGLGFWLEKFVKGKATGSGDEGPTVFALGFFGRILLWIIAILLLLDNVGINISALVTGLGIGGIAVALAVQNILGDLIASLSIILDKPFVVGDSISIEQHNGTVEHIGLKTTRIKSMSGEQIVFSNTDMLKARIRNYKQMQERRVAFLITVEYNTDIEKCEKVISVLKNAITAETNVRMDRVHLKELSLTGLLFEAVYFVINPDYNLHMDIRQRINFAVLKNLSELKVPLAYPTQTINLHAKKDLI